MGSSGNVNKPRQPSPGVYHVFDLFPCRFRKTRLTANNCYKVVCLERATRSVWLSELKSHIASTRSATLTSFTARAADSTYPPTHGLILHGEQRVENMLKLLTRSRRSRERHCCVKTIAQLHKRAAIDLGAGADRYLNSASLKGFAVPCFVRLLIPFR